MTIRSGVKRNFRHFVVLSFAGLVTDIYFGYLYNCKDIREDFEKANLQYEKEKKANEIKLAENQNSNNDTSIEK